MFHVLGLRFFDGMPGIMDYVKFEQIWHIIYGMCMQSSMDYNGFWFYHSCLRICILFISKEVSVFVLGRPDMVKLSFI